MGGICELTRGAFVWGIGAQQVPPLRYASVGMTILGVALPCGVGADEGRTELSRKLIWTDVTFQAAPSTGTGQALRGSKVSSSSALLVGGNKKSHMLSG
jgi:hypothetical protein